MAKSVREIDTPRRRVRRRRAAAEADDIDLGVLPDEVLLLILSRLDTRTALAAATLSRRLVREIPSLDFRVGDALPPRYHECVRLRRLAAAGTHDARRLDAAIGRYERRAIRGFTDSIHAFPCSRRRARRLRVEFFVTRSTAFVETLIATAVGDWGVDDLDVAVLEPAAVRSYVFHFRLAAASRIRGLAVSNCPVPPASELSRYTSLARLVLQDTHPRAPLSRYRDSLAWCPRLEALHLRRCGSPWYATLVIDAATPALRELVVERCAFHTVDVRAAPSLESVACVDSSVAVDFSGAGAAPRLARLTLDYALDARLVLVRNWTLSRLLDGCDSTPALTDLHVTLTGEHRWMTSGPLRSPLTGLRRVVVADVPSTWDVSWPRVILEAAPSLEALHIHVATDSTEKEEREEIAWPAAESARHGRLEEFVMVGFREARGQVGLVRHVVEACSALRRVVLIRRGRVEEDGYWDWKVVAEDGGGERPAAWSEVEKMVIRSQVKSASRPDLEVVIG